MATCGGVTTSAAWRPPIGPKFDSVMVAPRRSSGGEAAGPGSLDQVVQLCAHRLWREPVGAVKDRVDQPVRRIDGDGNRDPVGLWFGRLIPLIEGGLGRSTGDEGRSQADQDVGFGVVP